VTGMQGGTSSPTSAEPVGVLGRAVVGDGVFGLSTSGTGVAGYSKSGFGVYGRSDNASSFAGYFVGNVHVTGTVTVGAASTYQIDHPLDPANKYLTHAAVESSDMKDIYDGVVTLDAKGAATVTLPDWFEALNQDFRYQLTAIGAPGPNLYIAQEIQGNHFAIGGGTQGMKVSWQVTGIRHDPYATQHRMQIETTKPTQERGKYLYPQGYGQPETKGVDYADQQRVKHSQPGVPSQSKTP
jgi:hypothetical protein